MKEFKLEVAKNSPTVRNIQLLGALITGFSIACTLFWGFTDVSMSKFSDLWGVSSGALFGIFLGIGITLTFFGFGKPASFLTINEEGIFTHPHNNPDWGKNKRLKWNSISEIEIQKNLLFVTKIDGKTEKIKLPFYTKENWPELKNSLKYLARKEVLLSY